MKKNWPLLFILLVSLWILILHLMGTYLFFYWRYTGYDKIVHFSGGFLVAFVSLCIIHLERMPAVSRAKLWRLGFFAAVVIGIIWEIFELTSGNTAFTDKGYWLDNGGDVVFDVIGGIVAVYYFIRRYGRNNISS